MKKISKIALTTSVGVAQLVSQIPVLAEEVQPQSGYQFLSPVASLPNVEGNIVNISHTAGEKTRLTFLEDNLFRLDMEPDGTNFQDYPSPNQPTHTGRIVQQPDQSNEYTKPTPTVIETDDSYVISTPALSLIIQKDDARMTLKKANGDIVWEEVAPLQYKNGSTIQSLKRKASEQFYGGGTQNGRFVHTGQSIKIENTNNWVSGGVASPNPFYWSTSGYGIVRNTFRKGEYDFGKTDSKVVRTQHEERRFDAYYFIGDTPTSLLQGYYRLTGNPALFPLSAFYLGHLNSYNRDEWTVGGRTPLETINDTVKYTERNNGGQIKNGGQLESLNGTNDQDYRFSARAVIDQYAKYDIPLGWFLPNDGYGSGYGQNDSSLDANVDNLRQFTEYANAHGVQTGLWTQSDLTPNPSQPVRLQRDFEKEVNVGGIRTLKTDVAWVGPGYSFGLDGIAKAYQIIANASTHNRPTIVTLDGWAGTQRYGGIWTGDQTGGNWEYIRFHIPTYIGQSLSGNPNVSSDVDGIFGGSALIQTRDIQWKSFTTMMLDMDGWGSYPKKPYVFGENTTSINRMYLKLRSQLMPYIYSTAYTSANQGSGSEQAKPQVRAMFLEYPEDPYTYGLGVQYQFMLGPNLLVAPVYQNTSADEQGNDVRNGIYLPDENQVWIDYFTGKQYRGGQVLNGFDAPIWKLPLFVKNGAILPKYEAHNNPSGKTETNPKGLDRSKREVEFYPEGHTSYTSYEDAGNTVDGSNPEEVHYGGVVTTQYESQVENGTATLTAHASQGTYDGFVANRETSFVVNVSKKPSALHAFLQEEELELTEVDSLEAFQKATGPSYFYDTKPNLNTFASEGSEFANQKINTTPKLYVKFGQVDTSRQSAKLVLEGFVNDGKLDKNQLNQALQKVDGLNASKTTPTSVTLNWQPVDGATSYDVETDGVIQGGVTDAQFVHQDLPYHSNHQYRIRARNAEGYGPWSEPLDVQTAQDPYRNIPKNISVTWDYGDQWGAKKNILDLDPNTMFHSSSAVSEKQPLIMDMKKVYEMDKILYTPRQDNKGNGTVNKMDVYSSIDGQNWELVYDSSQHEEWRFDRNNPDPETKEISLNGKASRYLKYVVKKSVGGFFSAAELQPYKLEGTEGYTIGDTNNDGKIDSADVVQIDNYVGLEQGDPTWDQVRRSDWNNNGYYDVADIAQTTTRLVKQETTKKPEGRLIARLDKESYQAGESVVLTLSGIDMANVYALGGQISYQPEQLEYVKTSATLKTSRMREFVSDRQAYQGQGRRVNFAYSFLGKDQPLSGTDDLVTIEFKAKQDGRVDLASLLGDRFLFVANNRQSINPLTESEEVQPSSTIKKVPVTRVEGQDESVLQANMGPDKLIDGVVGTDAGRFEFKWGNSAEEVPARLPYTLTFHFDGVKTLHSAKISIRVDGQRLNSGALKDFDLNAYVNEDKTELGAYSITKVDQDNAYEIVFDHPVQADKIELVANSSQGGQVFKLNIDEVAFYENGFVPVSDLVLDEANPTEMSVGQLKGYVAHIQPEEASNQLYTVESSDESVVKVIRTTVQQRYQYTLQALKPGEVVITTTSGVKQKRARRAADEPIVKESRLIVTDNVDRSRLEAKLTEANQQLERRQLYTQVSVDELEKAIQAAQQASTQKEVNEQTLLLDQAIRQLEYKGSNEGQPDSETPIVPKTYTATSEAGEGPVGNAFDGLAETYWHSNWESGTQTLPQSVTMDLGAVYDVNQLNYLPRQNSNNGDVIEYEVSLSEDGTHFTPVVHGQFAYDGNQLVDKGSEKKIKFDSTPAQYVRFTALKSLGHTLDSFAAAAELKPFGVNHAERVSATDISLDQSQLTLQAGQKQSLQATLTPANTTDSITWTSSNPEIVSVNAQGELTAIRAGEAIITAKANDQVQKTVTVRVENPQQEQLQALIAEAKEMDLENDLVQNALNEAIAEAESKLDETGEPLKEAYYQLASRLNELKSLDEDVSVLTNYQQYNPLLFEENDALNKMNQQLEGLDSLLADPVHQVEAIREKRAALDEAFKALSPLALDKLAKIKMPEDLTGVVDDEALAHLRSVVDKAQNESPRTNTAIDQLMKEYLDALSHLNYEQDSQASQMQLDSLRYGLSMLEAMKVEDYRPEDGAKLKTLKEDIQKALAEGVSADQANQLLARLVEALELKPVSGPGESGQNTQPASKQGAQKTSQTKTSTEVAWLPWAMGLSLSLAGILIMIRKKLKK